MLFLLIKNNVFFLDLIVRSLHKDLYAQLIWNDELSKGWVTFLY